MIGVQDERDVQARARPSRWELAIQHVEKVAGMRQRAVRFNQRLAFANAIIGGDHIGQLRRHPNCFAHVGLVIVYFFFGIVIRQCGHDGAQHIHRQRMLGGLPQQADDRSIQLALARQVQLELLQFGAVRQTSKPEQIADFLEIGMVGKFVDVDAAVS